MFCVLWGHVIQALGDGVDIFHNVVYELIYSFHMPLFFFLSGFFFVSSMKLGFREFVQKKITQLLLPCLIWAVFYSFSRIILSLFFHESFILEKEIKSIISPLEWPFWFLKELFLSSIIVFASLKVLKRRWVAILISIMFVMIAPLCSFQRFLLPIFWIGFIMRDNIDVILSYSKVILFISGVLFIFCLFFWDGYYTIYISPFPQIFDIRTHTFYLSNLGVALFRFLIGVLGSIFFVFLFKYIYRKNTFFLSLERVGRYTLAIYILQYAVVETWISSLFNISVDIWLYNFVITPIVSITVICICLLLINIINRNDFIKYTLLGSSYQKVKISNREIK